MPTTDPSPVQLSELDLFTGCTRRQLQAAGTLLTPVTVPAGTVLMREGSWPTQAFIVVQGAARVMSGDPTDARTLAVVTGGEPLGEMSVLNHGRRTATVTTLVSTELLVATPRELRQLLDQAPSVEAKIVEIARRREESNLAA